MNYEVEFIRIFPCYYLISADCSAALQLPQFSNIRNPLTPNVTIQNSYILSHFSLVSKQEPRYNIRYYKNFTFHFT